MSAETHNLPLNAWASVLGVDILDIHETRSNIAEGTLTEDGRFLDQQGQVIDPSSVGTITIRDLVPYPEPLSLQWLESRKQYTIKVYEACKANGYEMA